MKLLKVIIIAFALSLSACATTGGQSPKQTAIKSGQLFKFKPSQFVWIPSGGRLSGGLASLFAGSVGMDSPVVVDLVLRLKPAKSKIVRMGVSGPNSALTASFIVAALENTPGPLPHLRLAFIGASEQEEKVRAAVKAKGGTFLFSDTTKS